MSRPGDGGGACRRFGEAHFVSVVIAVIVYVVVSDLCEDRPSCSVLASPETFTQDPCIGTSKYLEVHYKCSPSEFEELTVCEGDEMDIDCHRGNRIAIFAAMFGRRPNGTAQCPPYKQGYIDCQAAGTISEVRNQCHSRKKCSLLANASVFGDPCATGINKYLTVSYACVPKRYLKQLHRKSGGRRKKKKKKRKKKKKKKKKKRKGLDKLLPPDVIPTTTRDIFPQSPFDNFYETFEKEAVTHTEIERTSEDTSTAELVLNNGFDFDTSPDYYEETSTSVSSTPEENLLLSPSIESTTPSPSLPPIVTTSHQERHQQPGASVGVKDTSTEFPPEDTSHRLSRTTTFPTVVAVDDVIESGTQEMATDHQPITTAAAAGPSTENVTEKGEEKEEEKEKKEEKKEEEKEKKEEKKEEEKEEEKDGNVRDNNSTSTPGSVYDVLSSHRHTHQNSDNVTTTTTSHHTTPQPTNEEDTSVEIDSRTSDVKGDDDLRGVNLESDGNLGKSESENSSENSDNGRGNIDNNNYNNNNNNNRVRETTSSSSSLSSSSSSPERTSIASNPDVVDSQRPKGGGIRNINSNTNSNSNVRSQDEKASNGKKKTYSNRKNKQPPDLVVERNLTVLCPNNSKIPTDIRWRGRQRPRDVRTIGFLEDWFSAWHFLETHEEKAWLYFTLGICFGIIVLLIVILVKVCIGFKRNIRARLDVSEPTHRSAQINNHSSLDAPMLEHSDSIDRIEFVQFHPRGTLRSMRNSNSHNRDIVNYYG